MKKLPLFRLALLWVGVLFVQESLAQNDNPFSLAISAATEKTMRFRMRPTPSFLSCVVG